MKLLLPLIALAVLLLVSPVWSEEDDQYEAERAQLIEQGGRLIEQGALDYERLRQALMVLEGKKAALAASGGSLQAMDQLARKAQMLDADIIDLKKARMELDRAKDRLRTGRFEAAKQAFNEAVALWAPVHEGIVAHIGAAPVRVATVPVPGASAMGGESRGELYALRTEIHALRTEIQALRVEVSALRTLVQSIAR